MSNIMPDTEQITLTEHKAVIAALEKIAQEKNLSIRDMMQEGIRNEIRKYAENESVRKEILNILKDFEPKLKEEITSPTELAKFKREQRNFDNLMLNLKLETPDHIEENNSVVPPSAKIRVLEFGEHYV